MKPALPMELQHHQVADDVYLSFQPSAPLRKSTLISIVAFVLGVTIIYVYSPYSFSLYVNPTSLSTGNSSSLLNNDSIATNDGSLIAEPDNNNESDVVKNEETCDLSSGEWVPNPDAPYYTNVTCPGMYNLQNCMKFGKPSMSFLEWRWKPDGCELPTFDPNRFLQLVRGKSITFVGDSLARNHMQSLICLLSGVVYPVDLSPGDNKKNGNQHWVYRDYNFNISLFWNPFLVRAEMTDPSNAFGSYNLFLDECDEQWTSKIEGHNYIIISAALWYIKTNMFYENRTLVGCEDCELENVTKLSAFYGYEKALRTALRGINSLKNFHGLTFLRTITPTHFEGGGWNEGGDCVRTKPFRRNETVLAPHLAEMYRIQVRELKTAEEEGISKTGLRFRLIDVTKPMLLRPDGHPSKYGRKSGSNMPNDCTHWCMPGPVDTWNEILLELIRREEAKT
ncbi:OLC1v1011554C1 [Oldenlandia corymbosa var. corymbosa]|uniref:OLC1v1011554C1 n=1 Tax=Oldenlandia corymbosa var. corymbosa TaxID=529605 RepID=A0AAV1DTV6_OLDCO|nr:OLC1v1011554C1 [Oldenlandia corymbosa var. corymbosa]